MQRFRPNPTRVASLSPGKAGEPSCSLLSHKNLDLLLLASCSCLLTLLYHPVGDALQSASVTTRTGAIASVSASVVDTQVKSGLFAQMKNGRQELEES